MSENLILAANSGSSSLKITLFAARNVELILNCSISISPPAKCSFKTRDSANKEENLDSIKDHASAFNWFLDCLENVASIERERVKFVCHRVVHGGNYHEPVVITKDSYDKIEHLSDLAPLHNGAALSVIQACVDALPDAKSIAYFDTSFHRSIPLHIASYAIDPKVAKDRGLKKYGFHGLSYAYILRSVANHLNKPPDTLNLIVLHLGSGASACAIKNGASFDTSMGLTPVHGLPGATRSGAIDPTMIFHYTNRAGRITHDPSLAAHIGVTLAEDILNRQSGWNSIAGTTDFGEISQKADLSNSSEEVSLHNPCRLAFDLFVDRILNYVGAYHLKLGGEVDALVFAGGIGEKSAELRRVVGEKVRCLGYQELDEEKNKGVAASKGVEVVQVSREGPRRRILVCHTDEQFEMANDCAKDTSRWASQPPSKTIK